MKNEKTPSYIKVGILTIVTTIFWIFFSVYRTLTTQPAPNIPASILVPFDPTLDTDKIQEIESRISFDEGQSPTFAVATETFVPEVEEELPTEPTEEPIATQEATPTVTPAPEEEVFQ